MSCLIVFRTMTQAQHAASILNNQHFSTHIIRPPLEAGKGSCSAALRLPQHQLKAAKNLLSKLSFQPLGYYQILTNGSLQEVFL